jgi:hypothetical protein
MQVERHKPLICNRPGGPFRRESAKGDGEKFCFWRGRRNGTETSIKFYANTARRKIKWHGHLIVISLFNRRSNDVEVRFDPPNLGGLMAVLSATVLLAQNAPVKAAEEATPLEAIQIITGNYRKGGNVGAIGHLGGVPVSIPKEFAHFVEYDGDPGFLEKRKGPVPKRTFESGICSFGFDIRYPDMMPVNKQTLKDKLEENIYTTMWMGVGILSNSAYGYDGPDKMTRFAKYGLENGKYFHRYEEQPERRYGLVVFVPVDVDLSRRDINSGNPKGRDSTDINIYHDRANDGTVSTYIRCSNTNHEAATCKHFFDLSPEMKASVNILYRKGLLQYWREIQDGVTRTVLGFRVDATKKP